MKAMLLDAGTATLEVSVRDSLAAMARSFTGPDLAEAIAARREGRAPRFGGTPVGTQDAGVSEGGQGA